MDIARIGEPRRHDFHFDGCCNFVGPGSSLLIGLQGHRCWLFAAMTALALVLKYGQDVSIKSWRSLFLYLGDRRRRLPRRGREQQRKSRQEKRTEFLHERRNSKVRAQTCRAE